MLNVAVAALACLYLARSSPADTTHSLRTFVQASHTNKDLSSVLTAIDERLRLLDTISAVQVKQARRLEVIQDKLDRVETTLSLRLERAQLAAERLEHRLHMLQTNVQIVNQPEKLSTSTPQVLSEGTTAAEYVIHYVDETALATTSDNPRHNEFEAQTQSNIEGSIRESSDKLDRSQLKITEIALNLTTHIEGHRRLLEKVNGAYADTWRRGLVLENMMRDGLSLVNVTRRELADGLRALARRQRDARMTSADLEASFVRRLNDNTYKIDLKMQEVLDAQKRFMDSCQRVQLDDPTHVADVLDKLIDSLINKTAATFHELQNIQVMMRNHDNKVMKLLSTARAGSPQNDFSCKRLESAFKNVSHTAFKEVELQQLTEKFVALTDRADAALQRLESRMMDDRDDTPANGVTADADRLLLKLEGIKSDTEEDQEWENEDSGYFDDGGGGDMMDEDRQILSGIRHGRQVTSPPPRTPHRRHLHKHPYDRGPRRPSKHP